MIAALLGVGIYTALLLLALVNPDPDALGALVVAPVLVLATVPIATRLARADRDRTVVSLLMAAVIVKLVASIVRYWVAFDVYGGASDAADYDSYGRLFAPHFRSLDFAVDAAGKVPGTGFLRLVTGGVYAIVGSSKLSGFLAFAFLAFLGQVLLWRAFKRAVPEGDSRRYALLILFFPSMLYWPASIGKESWMLLAIGLAAYGAASMLRRRPAGVLALVLGLTAATMVRPHMALILVVAFVAAMLLRPLGHHAELALPVRILSLAAVLAIGIIVVSQTETFLGVERLDQESVEETLTTAEEKTAGGSSSFTPVRVHTPLDLPAATVTVLFRPFPFEAGSAQLMASALEGAFLAALCLVSWRRLASIPSRLRRNPYVAFALVFVLVFVYGFSSFGNFGLLARERAQVLPFLFVLLALPRRPRRPSPPPLFGPSARGLAPERRTITP